MMLGFARELYAHRDLLWLWTAREIRIRYKQSVLGAAWAILQPLALMIAFSLVFSVLMPVPSDGVPYPLFVYTALLVWTFLSSAVSFGIPTLVNNFSLVTKVYFPREILPLASVAASLFDFAVASLVLVVALIWYQVPLSPTLAWLPVLVLLQVVFVLGVVLPGSAVNVFYRDVRFILPVGIQLWLYATPVIYPVTMVPEGLRSLYALNPMVGIVDSYRRVILHGLPPVPEYLAISAVAAFALIGVGYAYFKHAEPAFADLI